MKEEKDFLQWYQNKIRENAQDPPEDAWDNISDRLDIKDVWGRVSEELDQKDRMLSGKAKVYYATMVLLLLVMIGGVIGTVKFGNFGFNEPLSSIENKHKGNSSKIAEEEILKNIDQKKLNTENTDSLNKSAESLTKKERKKENISNDHHKNDQKIAHNQSAPKQELKMKNFLKGGDHSTHSSEGTEEMLVNNDQANFEKAFSDIDSDQKIAFLKPRYSPLSFSLPGISMSIADSATFSERMLTPSNTETAEQDHKDRTKGAIKIGLTASVKNTWLLNKATYSGLEKNTLHTTVPDFGKDIGVLLDYTVSEKLGVSGEAIIAEMGQKYKEYRHGKYVTREVNLKYYTFNLLLKYKINRFLGERGSDIVIGGYGSALSSAHEVINDEAIDQKNQFSTHDFGAVIGYEFNREVLKNVIFTSGLRFNYGFRNVYIEEITSTGSLALNFAIKYKITRKE
jgi:hypothetical protein